MDHLTQAGPDRLDLPDGFAYPDLITRLSPRDSMFDGNAAHYLNVGLSALELIKMALRDAPPATILDLPCGYGRVTRMLRAAYPQARITACDLDREAVDFTAATFNAAGVYSETDFKSLRLGGRFDLIWVGSLLTHLPEHLTRKFLDFAVRHMGPQSRLVVTSHGRFVAERLGKTSYGLEAAAARGLQAEYLLRGYGYRGYDGGASYGISLTSRRWFETLLAGSALRLESYLERGWDRHQDVLVLRRAPAGLGWRLRPARKFEDPACPPPPPGEAQARQDAAAVPGFDEAWYCAQYPDIGAATAAGAIESGAAHFRDYGWQEGRAPFDPARAYEQRMPARPEAWLDGAGFNQVSDTWSASPEETSGEAGWYWLAHPAVRARVNILASGRPDQDAYARLETLLRERGTALPIARSLSIGCGFGGLERDLTQRGMVAEIDAYDLAPRAIAEARRQAEALGYTGIRYHVADLEKVTLPAGSLDAVFAHSSVHHVERLEALYAAVQRALRPGGVFHLHEFVGPTRFQWTDEQLRLGNEFLESLPARLRRQPDGTPKTLRRPTVEEMIAADPSEAIRSDDLVAALEPYFEIVEKRDLGGALAHLALGGIAQNFDPDAPEDMAFLERLFAAEDAAMRSGAIRSDFATITAVPKDAARR